MKVYSIENRAERVWSAVERESVACGDSWC
jgi:hypothetical protein